MLTPRDSAVVSSHRVHNPSREANGWVWDPSDHRQGSRQVFWVPQPLAEQISGTWATAQPVSESDGESGASRLHLSPSHKTDVRRATQPQFLHLKQGQWQHIHTFWQIKPPIHSVKVRPLLHSTITTNSHVLCTQDRKVLRGHFGHWVCDQKQDPRM